MSRIGKQPIKIPKEVTVNINDSKITIKGPKGELTLTLKKGVNAQIDNQEIKITINKDDKFWNSLHGLYRSLINNMTIGVTTGWSKGLELSGVGYRAALTGNKLTLSLGFSHPVNFELPSGITGIIKENKIMLTGIDKQLIGETAAKIRRIKPPEPYKGKGIRYIGEQIRRKAGKVVKAAGAGTTAGK